MAEVIPQITIDGSKVKGTWVQNEVVTNDVYNAINKAVINLKDNNNLLDSNAMLFREEYNSSSKNLNNAIHQGIYSFTSSAVNAPSGVNGGNLLVTNTSKTEQGSSIITQIAFCHNGAIYARTKNTSENFTSWNKLAYITDNVASATKATQDSQGQQINTTYVKSVTGSDATLTITKGNGTTSTVTITNVDRALNSVKATQDGQGQQINTTYVKKTGDNNMSGFFGINTACGLGITSSYMGFYDNTNTTYVLRYNTGENYVTAITPPTSDNSTKLATTAFVKSLFTASKQDNGWWKDGNTGLIYQWRKKQTDGNSSGFYSNFPITFPNALLLVIPTDCIENQTAGSLSYVAWGPDSSDTSKVYLKVNTGNNVYSYLAIGY